TLLPGNFSTLFDILKLGPIQEEPFQAPYCLREIHHDEMGLFDHQEDSVNTIVASLFKPDLLLVALHGTDSKDTEFLFSAPVLLAPELGSIDSLHLAENGHCPAIEAVVQDQAQVGVGDEI
ncbi:TPA: hypothetical protein ACQT1D_006830, partial [Pseudomonas aeruginosa]